MFERNLKKPATVLIAALIVGLCFNEAALARGGHGGGGHGGGRGNAGRSSRSFNRGGRNNSRASRARFGNRGGRHGYHQRNHRWAYSRYYGSYGCNLYYDNDDQCWYYWCLPDACYYPVDYCPYGTYCSE